MSRYRRLVDVAFIVVSLAANYGQTGVTDTERNESLKCDKLDDCMKLARTELFTLYDSQTSRHSSARRRCHKFSSVERCMKSVRMSSDCLTTSAYRHWTNIRSALICACRAHSRDCVAGESCVYAELRGVWVARCDDLYHFNLLQNTRSPCHFAALNRRCQLAVVHSACRRLSPHSATLAHSLLRMRTDTMTSSCQHRDDADYVTDDADDDDAVFRYSDRCRRTFAADVDSCNAKHLTHRHVVRFHSRNELVAVDSPQAIHAACKAVRLFKSCTSPMKSSCGRGVEMLLNSQPNLHKYLLKMNVICRRRVLPVYQSSSRCYREVMERRRLDDCNALWTQLAGALSNVTAYQFYCQLNDTKRRHLLTRINSLRVCHKHQFTRYCGTAAADVMEVLLRRALNDPVFLRYRYRPHCAAHATPTPPQTTTTLTLSSVMKATLTSKRPSVVDSTIGDELTALTFVDNTTSVTSEWDRSRHGRTDNSGAERRCVTLNVSVVTTLLTVSICTFTIK